MRPNRSLNHKKISGSFKALELLENPAETKGFLKDLCTPSELMQWPKMESCTTFMVQKS